MRTHETHRGASFTALPSPLLYSRCLRRLFSQRWWLLSMSMSCLPSQTTEHGRRPAKHTDNTARHGAAFRWNNMAVTARLRHAQHRSSKSKSKDACDLDTLNNKKQQATTLAPIGCSRQKISAPDRKCQGARTLLSPNTTWPSPRRRCRSSRSHRTSDTASDEINDVRGSRQSFKTCNGAGELAV